MLTRVEARKAIHNATGLLMPQASEVANYIYSCCQGHEDEIVETIISTHAVDNEMVQKAHRYAMWLEMKKAVEEFGPL